MVDLNIKKTISDRVIFIMIIEGRLDYRNAESKEFRSRPLKVYVCCTLYSAGVYVGLVD